MNWASEGRVIERAVNQMRAAGVGVAAARVEQVVAAVNAAEAGDVLQGRSVVALHLTPDGQTVKTIQLGSATPREFAQPSRYWEASNDDLLTAPAPSKLPTSQTEADALDQTRSRLVAMLPGLDRGRRQKAEDRILAIEDLLRRWRKLDQSARAGTS